MSAYYGEPDTYEDIRYSFADAEDDYDPTDDYTPAELEEYYAAQAEQYDPDSPYADLSENDIHALECEHKSIVIGNGNTRSCEDCDTVWR